MPVEVLAGKGTYPTIEAISDLIRKLTSNLYMIDAATLAEQAGDARTANIVMLGALDGCQILPFQSDFLRESMTSAVPNKMVEANLKAFDLGRASVLA
jgi:indolepyruvate ferredoxin oxidoreductase beta subunit